jgi:hypothetical protein
MHAAAKQQEQSPVSAEYERAVKAQKQSATVRGRAKRRAEFANTFAEEIADMQTLHGESFDAALDRLMAEHEELDRQVCQILDFAGAAA